MISAHFSLQWLLRVWRNLHLLRSFLRSNVLQNFFEFLSTEFAVCSKPQPETIIAKRLIQERNNMTRMRVEPRSCDQSRRKNDAIALLAALQTIPYGRAAAFVFPLLSGQFQNTFKTLHYWVKFCRRLGQATLLTALF